MMDLQARYEKLLADAAECAELREHATDPAKQELFGRLCEHLATLASLMERAIGLQSAAEARHQPSDAPSESTRIAV
jgi:hypothetical protein